MSRLTEKGQSAPIEVFKSSTDTSLNTLLGTRFDSADGREFVLVLAGAVNIAQGVIVQSSALVSGNENLAVVAASATGATSVSATNGGTALTANQYAGGYLVVNAGTGLGQTLKIASHPAVGASATATIALEDALISNVAASSSKVSLIANPGNGVVVAPTTITGKVLGGALYPLATATYGLVQSKGLIGIASETSTASSGGVLTTSGATAGFVKVATAPAGVIGVAVEGGVSGEYRAIWLNL